MSETRGRQLSKDELACLHENAVAYVRAGNGGTVQALRIPSGVTWMNDYGSVLQAHAGDWIVTDGKKVWSVVNDYFQRNYAKTPEGYERVGWVLAVRLREDARVMTLEGEAYAQAGDWVCWERWSEDCWPVTDKSFRALYPYAELFEDAG